MKTYFLNQAQLPKIEEKLSIAIGNFDGLHLGHKKLIQKCIALSSGSPAVLTFEPHPRIILNPITEPFIITSLEQKIKIFDSLGIQKLFILNFDSFLADMSAEEFVDKILLKLNPKRVVVGFNFTFGKKGLGNGEILKNLGKNFFDTSIIEPVRVDDQFISSTKIRRLIVRGNIKGANKLLGRKFALRGRVIKGSQRGQKLGFATANLKINPWNILPKLGVYEVEVLVKKKEYIGLVNIGTRPTFNENGLSIEVHVLDFEENIYAETIEVSFVRFLREEIKFNSKSELVLQIQQDIASVSNL